MHLLDLPTEMLQEICSWLSDDHDTLANLALVNKQCHELAMTLQYAVFEVNSTSSSTQIVSRLVVEALEGMRLPESGGSSRCGGLICPTFGWHIGPYIRELRINPEPLWKTLPPFDEMREQLSKALINTPHQLGNVKTQRARRACEALIRMFKPHFFDREDWPNSGWNELAKALLVIMPFEMPNIAVLEIESSLRLGKDGWAIMVDCAKSLRTLKLHGNFMAEDYDEVQVPPGSWSLESLDLFLPIDRYRRNRKHLSRSFSDGTDRSKQEAAADERSYTSTILEACAPTLRKLTFQDTRTFMSCRPAAAAIEFPALQDLTVKTSIAEVGILRTLFNSPVRRLRMGLLGDSRRSRLEHPQVWNLIPLRDANMPALEHIDLPGLSSVDEAAEATEFLQRHRQIQRLHIAEGCNHPVLHGHITPFLAHGGLPSLTSLSLDWTTSDIPRISDKSLALNTLAAIGQIDTLQHLHLVLRSTCRVDHQEIGQHLRGLQDLRLLAISGDTRHLEAYRLSPARGWISPWDLIDARIDVGFDGMFASIQTMIEIRARPDLDRNIFEELQIPEGEHPNWQYHEESDGKNLERRIGPINDRYRYLDERTLEELIHRNATIAEAERYAVVFGKLEMVYLARMLMKIKLPGRGDVVPLAEELDVFPLSILDAKNPESAEPE